MHRLPVEVLSAGAGPHGCQVELLAQSGVSGSGSEGPGSWCMAATAALTFSPGQFFSVVSDVVIPGNDLEPHSPALPEFPMACNTSLSCSVQHEWGLPLAPKN